jgi:hypothetical protein
VLAVGFLDRLYMHDERGHVTGVKLAQKLSVAVSKRIEAHVTVFWFNSARLVCREPREWSNMLIKLAVVSWDSQSKLYFSTISCHYFLHHNEFASITDRLKCPLSFGCKARKKFCPGIYQNRELKKTICMTLRTSPLMSPMA